MNLASLTLAETRPVISAGLLLLSMIAASTGGYSVVRSHFSWQPIWRHSFRLGGWLPLMISVLLIAVILALPGASAGEARGMAPFAKGRLIETVIPLAMALQAAYVLSLDDEPTLEILLSYPRPTPLLLMDRLATIWLGQGSIALVGAMATVALGVEGDLALALLRWIPTAALMSGLALNASLRSRRGVFGVVSALLIWFVVGFFHQAFLPGQPTFWPLNYLQPWLWAVHPYLQPSDMAAGDYLLNRLFVLVLGINLIGLALQYVRDSERLLTGKPALKHQS